MLGRQKVQFYSLCHYLQVVTYAITQALIYLAHLVHRCQPHIFSLQAKAPDEPVSWRSLLFLFPFTFKKGLHSVIRQIRPCHNVAVNSLLPFL